LKLLLVLLPLIDTGANVTILSKQFIENIQPSLLSQVNPVNVHLVTATGETSPFIGQINVQISLIFIAWGLLVDA
jgi:predicted aspartyl protease